MDTFPRRGQYNHVHISVSSDTVRCIMACYRYHNTRCCTENEGRNMHRAFHMIHTLPNTFLYTFHVHTTADMVVYKVGMAHNKALDNDESTSVYAHKVAYTDIENMEIHRCQGRGDHTAAFVDTSAGIQLSQIRNMEGLFWFCVHKETVF